MSNETHVKIAIIGSGFGGIGVAFRLKNAGFDDFVILERAGDVGGVWRDNQYPGCACDVHSHLYSFSFAKNPEWTRAFSPQPEIWAYLKDCAERFGVVPHVRLNHDVTSATWNESLRAWRIETSQGVFVADVLISAAGALSDAAMPKIEGMETFEGPVFHSAGWKHDIDLTNRKVAVIGTGASAIQFVPQIQPKVKKLSLFQRTPPWVVPRRDHAISDRTKQILKNYPLAQNAIRTGIYGVRELLAIPFMRPRIARLVQKQALAHLHKAVKDSELRKKLTPSYVIGCKRILISDDYYPAVAQPNVEVVTSPIREIRAHGIVTADGTEHEADAIIFGTGFQIQDYPLAKKIRGRGKTLLADTWKTTMTAHLGTTVHGYPNLFLVLGPNTGLGHTSVLVMIESQIEHIVQALRYMHENGVIAIEPREEAQEKFVREVDAKMATTVWSTGGCKSWYLDKNGRNSTLWPGFTFTFRRRAARFDPSEY
ncbi:MAG: flavin-containing monooxygenase, partial [Polyangiaceae bacterium]